jgi:oligogalacturonide transport system permease protein
MRTLRHNNIAYVYIAPWIIGFLVFQLYPFCMSFFYSFTNFSMLNSPKLTGFKNYIDIFTRDRHFYQSVRVTLIYTLAGVPLKLAFALIVAVLMNIKFKGINIFRTIYYLPSIFGGSVGIAILWRSLFNRDGAINHALSVLSLGPFDWLGSPELALLTLCLLTIWQFGSSMVIFLAGLKQVPEELYEAAMVDGSGRVRSFFAITLPFLTPMILFNLIMQTITSLQQFASAYNITNGGPLQATYLYGLMLYENAFKFLKMGYASAQSWILFLIVIVFTVIIFKSSLSWVHYEDGGTK